MLQLLLHHFHVFLDLLVSDHLKLTSSFLLLGQLLQFVILLLQICMLNNRQPAMQQIVRYRYSNKIPNTYANFGIQILLKYFLYS